MKRHALTNQEGLPIRLELTPGQAHDAPVCKRLLDALQNAYIERYNRTVRHEWPPLGDCSQSPAEQRAAQEQATKWLWTYNNDRPNMGIGGIIPAMKLKMAT